jgi:hypothetical protein
MAHIPTLDELPAPPRRIILHWTGGPYRANAVDRKAYHYIVEHDGNVVQGVHPVAHNMQRVWGENYARHTGGFNSFSVGISFAGMMDFVSAGNPGPAPLKAQQVLAGLRFTAECCDAWNLDPLDPAQVFHHREAWELHGVKGEKNHQKRDITHLPFMPELGFSQTGPWMRRKIAEILGSPGAAEPSPQPQPQPQPLFAPVPVPGERRWSPSLGWIRLVRYVSDREWFFRLESRPDAPITRAGIRWSEMPRRPPM